MCKKIICLILIFLLLCNSTLLAGEVYDRFKEYTVIDTLRDVDLSDKRNEAQGADPVDLLTGNYDYKATDFSLSGRGIGLTFVRTYNSFQQEKDRYSFGNKSFGDGWNFNYNIRLIEEKGQDYICYGDNKYNLNSLELTGTYGEPKGLSYEFIQTGFREKKIKVIRDIYGNEINFRYNDNGILQEITDTVGRKYTFYYNNNDQIYRIDTPGGYNYIYRYDIEGRLMEFISPAGTTRYSYDRKTGFLKSIYDPDGVKRLENFYDDKYRVKEQFYDGGYFQIDYDGEDYQNKHITITSRKGEKISYKLDKKSGRAERISHQASEEREYDDMGFFTKINSINYEYDAQHNVTEVNVEDINFKLNLEYNEYDQLTRYVDALDNTIDIEYDGQYLEKITTSSGVSVNVESNQYGQITKADNYEYYYDDYGHLDYVKDSAGNITDFSSDILGRLKEQKDARGNITRYEYQYYGLEKATNPRGYSINYNYDSKGNLRAVQDSMTNKEISYHYDQWDNLQKVIDPLGNSTSYTYNNEEQLIKVQDSKGNKIIYEYNAYNSIGEIRYINTSGLNYTYEYDKYGRLKKEYDHSGNEISYQYNPNGSVKEIKDSMGDETLYYYENGRISKTENNGVITEYHYDDQGRIDYLSREGKEIRYQYNSLNQIEKEEDVLGREIEYTYNEVGDIESMTVPGQGTFSYTYNNLNQIESITTPEGEEYSFSYDQAGRRTRVSYPNGKEMSYSYDDYGRLKTYDNGIKTYTYSYDNTNITEVETKEGKISYEYDNLDRLTGVSYPDGERIKYSYDIKGNRAKKTVITSDGEEKITSYSYDFSNRMIRAGNIRYEYDDKDRMVKKIDGEDTYTYSYNSSNQLIAVDKNGKEIASFSYDLMGRRISESIDGETKEYLWAGDTLLGEYSNNTLEKLYTVGSGVDEVLGIYNDNGEAQYLHSNHLGSITGVTTIDGEVIGEKDYTPFGLTRDTAGEIDTDLGFIGRKQYEELGLVYIRARFYESSSGRFITKDPVRDGFNWYSYCSGNPVSYVDRSGEEGVLIIVGGGLLLLGIATIYAYYSNPEIRRDLDRALNDISRKNSRKENAKKPFLNSPANKLKNNIMDSDHPHERLLKKLEKNPLTGISQHEAETIGNHFKHNDDDPNWKKNLKKIAKWIGITGIGIIGGGMFEDMVNTWNETQITPKKGS